MGVANVPAASAAGLQPKYQKFTSSGTFTLPTGYGPAKPLLVNIQIIGGGGAGSGFTNTTSSNATFAYNINLQKSGFFGVNGNFTGNYNPFQGTYNGTPGGSGGLAATQMYLTSDLSITVGAAGTRAGNTFAPTAFNALNTGTDNSGNNVSQASWYNNTYANWRNSNTNSYAFPAGNNGGTTTAGSVSATGGNAGNSANIVYNTSNSSGDSGAWSDPGSFSGSTFNARNVGTGGTPSGTSGDATPLLGTIAGGSSNSVSVKGSFGIGGVVNDGGTNTGVEGTGGGSQSTAASGAVILTWWE